MYRPAEARYDRMPYRPCGNSGLRLPAVSLGLWHNFGGVDDVDVARQMARRAFDLGVTHFDLANNYGPPPGSAETTLGWLLREDFGPFRQEMVISSKAGYWMWPGPYGDGGSRKYLLSSLDHSLRRMGLEYVDIFYHHRPDPDTPVEESMRALDQAVRQGKAIYAGISNYSAEGTAEALSILRDLGTPVVIHQPKYSMFDRDPENGLLDVLGKEGIGCIAYSPLAQGILTDKYLHGIPETSRAASKHGALSINAVTPRRIEQARALNEIASERGQSLAQMALAWVLRRENVTSVLIGASSVAQLEENIASLDRLAFEEDELGRIDEALREDPLPTID